MENIIEVKNIKRYYKIAKKLLVKTPLPVIPLKRKVLKLFYKHISYF